MDRDRLGGDASKPGDLPSDFDDYTAAQPGGGASQPDQQPAAPGNVRFDQRPRLTVQSGGIGAAERISSAPGSTHRGSHGFEVVHFQEPREMPRENQFDPTPPGEAPGSPGQENDVAARMMREIEEAVAELRRHAAGRLICLQKPGGPPSQAPGKAQGGPLVGPCGALYDFFVRVQGRARRLASGEPTQSGPRSARFWRSGAKIAAAVLSFGLIFRVALRLRK